MNFLNSQSNNINGKSAEILNKNISNPISNCISRYQRLSDEAINEIDLYDPVDLEYCKKVKKLVLLVSSSRSGSSWFSDVLNSTSQLISILGELDPLLLTAIDANNTENHEFGFSDALDAGDLNENISEKMSLLLSWKCGSRKLRNDIWHFSKREIYDITMRTVLQWPEIEIDETDLLRIVELFFGNTLLNTSPNYVFLNYLKCLKDFHKLNINPYYYDINYSDIRRIFPKELLPSGPPSRQGVIEEPPFIPYTPWKWASPKERLDKPLIIKSPSNAYRLNFLRGLFPNAEIILVHLVRKPISVITGLMCGWKHHGFFKHCLKKDSLNIRGYSNHNCSWSRRWWKYDLPPNWNSYINERLENVCRFQWLSANNHILQFVEKNVKEITYYQIEYELIVNNLSKEVFKLFKKIGITPDTGLLKALEEHKYCMSSSGISLDQRREFRTLAQEVASCCEVLHIEQAIDYAKNNF